MGGLAGSLKRAFVSRRSARTRVVGRATSRIKYTEQLTQSKTFGTKREGDRGRERRTREIDDGGKVRDFD